MSVCRFIPVVMTNADVFAVARFPADLLDDAIAGRVDRCTARSGPINACVHLRVTEDRMPPQTEARPHNAGKHGLANQELLRALSGLVVVVDQPVVR